MLLEAEAIPLELELLAGNEGERVRTRVRPEGEEPHGSRSRTHFACFCLLVMMRVGASCGWRKGARYFGMGGVDGKKRWMDALEAIQGGRLGRPRGSLPSRDGLELVVRSEREVARGIVNVMIFTEAHKVTGSLPM